MWINFRDLVLRPTVTFRDVSGRPRWLAPLAAVTLASVIVSLLGWPTMAEIVRQTMPELGPGAPPGMEALTLGTALAAAIFGPVVGTPVATLIYAVLLWGWARLVGAAGARLEAAVAALAYAALIGVFSSAADVITLMLSPGSIEPVSVRAIQPLSLAALFEAGAIAPPFHAALAHVNAFSLWWAGLLAVAGVHAVGMPRGPAIGFAVLAWVATGLLLVLGAAVAALSGGGRLPGAPVAL
jgi:hypothetical protein